MEFTDNLYNPRLNQKLALWAISKERNNNFQHYNVLSANEVKDETSTTSILYVSLVFYMVRSRGSH
jgi:hypothetical protein